MYLPLSFSQLITMSWLGDLYFIFEISPTLTQICLMKRTVALINMTVLGQ